MKKLFFIHASTGCSCCSDQNHWRGPYETKEDAERRVAYYESKNSKFWPLASQFASRGKYSIAEKEVEEISGGRYIIGDHVFHSMETVYVKQDGTVYDGDNERFCSDDEMSWW